MRLEIEAMLDALEEKLTREGSLKVARIVAESDESAKGDRVAPAT